VRSCGNAKTPTDVVTTFGWYPHNDPIYTSNIRPTTQIPRKFLGAGPNLSPATWRACRSSAPLFNGFATASFNADLVSYEASFRNTTSYNRTIGYGLPACCTAFFSGARDFPVDSKCCEDWLLTPATRVNFSVNPTCPRRSRLAARGWDCCNACRRLTVTAHILHDSCRQSLDTCCLLGLAWQHKPKHTCSTLHHLQHLPWSVTPVRTDLTSLLPVP
jgi:hypothetical protein